MWVELATKLSIRSQTLMKVAVFSTKSYEMGNIAASMVILKELDCQQFLFF